MPDGVSSIAEHNRQIFEHPKIVRYYTGSSLLSPAEAQIFNRHAASYTGKRVLDLGVGGGRTTACLATSSNLYVGIDYSTAMVDLCKQRFPQYRFEHGDARDLSRFESGTFDFVLFSFNGLDFVDHADRARVLQEVQRVLAPGGLYVFSTHSLEHAMTRTSWRVMYGTNLPKNALQAVKGAARAALRIGNYARRRHMQVHGNGYAILLDPGHDYTLPIYYVTIPEQQRQLDTAGFQARSCILPEYGTHERACKPPPYAHYYVTAKR